MCYFPHTVLDSRGFRRVVPCGGCLECRIGERNRWVARLLLEAEDHDEACFVTLTFAPESLPENDTWEPAQRFLKRLREKVGSIRFFGCMEHGSRSTARLHYHLILFGVSAGRLETCLSSLWPSGWASVGGVTMGRMRYVAGYTTKKLGEKAAAFSSRRPGIGLVGLARVGWNRAVHNLPVTDQGGTIALSGVRFWLRGTERRALLCGYLTALRSDCALSVPVSFDWRSVSETELEAAFGGSAVLSELEWAVDCVTGELEARRNAGEARRLRHLARVRPHALH